MLKNKDCYGNKHILSCDDEEACVLYFKNKKWHYYGTFSLKKSSDIDNLIQEVMWETNVAAAAINLVKPVSVNFEETSLQQIEEFVSNKKKLAAKKQIEELKKKWNL